MKERGTFCAAVPTDRRSYLTAKIWIERYRGKMKKFEYIIKEVNGIHARPAGLLVKVTKGLDSTITLEMQQEKPPQQQS